MVNRQRDEDTGGEFDGDWEPGGLEDVFPVFFDVADMSDEEAEWRPGLDDTRSMRAAKAGERAVWRMLRGVKHHGSRVRTKAWLTREGEPVTRVDLHPDGWLELEARMRELEAQADEAQRSRRTVTELSAMHLLEDCQW